eukprot:CAMPEP_0181425724 /NCGR_PEP_ID=MMETSP1110-20121109/15304_1 /TAXON_ID=174948 /ORGANISM="Symbiodinium sp., Strain CCMP421" /LENGTH=531 /DNA_ID=CAMNT_0023548915 /DNA_START=88 /DNA_END=1683 /DNA_ORIENTATION=+
MAMMNLNQMMPNAKERASKEKMQIESEVFKLLKVNPRDVKQKLSVADLKVHHEALQDTQEEVEDHLLFITSLQLLNQAMRNRDLKKLRAQESVMQMFITKCLCTIFAWLLSAVAYQLIVRVLSAMFEGVEDADQQQVRQLMGYTIYAVITWTLVPILQHFVGEIDSDDHYSRAHAAVDLLAKAMPMILAWAFKDVVQTFLAWTDQPLWDEIIVAVVLVILVSAISHIPRVGRAKKELAEHPPIDTIANRYLSLPYNSLLGVGYAINQVAVYFVQLISHATSSKLPDGAVNVLEVMVQILYFGLMSIVVIRIDAAYHRRRLRKQRLEKDGEEFEQDLKEAELTKFEMELLASNLGDTVTHSLAFVYGWGVSDTLRVIYYPFFMGCDTYKVCSYQQTWYFGIIVTAVLGSYIKTLSLQEYRRPESKSYRTLMINAMSLTVGWAWMNVCEVTSNFFVDQWNSVHPSVWTKTFTYLILLVFLYAVMVEIYYQILDELRYIKRERNEFHAAYPAVPDSIRQYDLEQRREISGLTGL